MPHPTAWKALLPELRGGVKDLEIVEYAGWVELLKQCDPDDIAGLRARPAVKLVGCFGEL